MTQSGSYNVSSFATSVDAEIRRLNAQVDLFWSMELPLLLKYGLRKNMDILDCGCGTGRMIELLKDNIPDLRCTGLEMDQHLVAAATTMITTRQFQNCRVIQGTAENTGLMESSFDFIILRLVLEHVLDPVLALKNLNRHLRPGGRIVVVANDFEFHLRTWPPVPQLDLLYEAYCTSRRKDGGDPCIGRRLPHLLLKADFNVVGYEIELAHNALLGDNPFLKAEGAGIPAQLVRTGFLQAEVLEEMTHAWRSMLADPNHSIMRPLFVAVGERMKPGDKPRAASTADKSTASSASFKEEETAQIQQTIATGKTLDFLMPLVTEILAAKLSEFGREYIDPDDLLADLGMNSLDAMQLQERVRDKTGIEIPIVKILDNISVSSLAKILDAKIAERAGGVCENSQPKIKRSSSILEEGEI